MCRACGREQWREGSRERQSATAELLEVKRDDPRLDLPKTGGHLLYRGFLLITNPGRHELIVTAGSSIRLSVDGEVRLDNPTVYRKRAGERLSLELAEGLREIELEVWAGSSQPRLQVEWITPDATEKRAIPQSCFFYDPLTR